MPNFNIHWKGYPHYRLPRIRVVSTCQNSVQSRSLSTSGRSSRTASRAPYQEGNSKQLFRTQFRRRRVRSSRAASSVARARRRASVRARHHIQVFGWDTPGAELASRVTNESTGPRHLASHRRSGSKVLLRSLSREDSGIPSTDGAASSAVREINPSKKKASAYPPRNSVKVPVYWSAGHPSPKDSSSNPDLIYSAQKAVPLREASNRILTNPSSTFERKRTYDTKVDPERPTFTEPYRPSTRPEFKPINFRQATSQVSPRRKNTDIGSPEFWEAVKNYRNQSEARGTYTASGKSVIQSLVSDSASRSPSQKRALSRFKKGIELYLQSSKSLPQQSIISPLSTTTVSAYTIQELKPYQSEFQSAGLAITSAEQKGMAKLQKGLTPPPTPPKDDRFEKRRSSPAKKGYATQEGQTNKNTAQKNKYPSYASQSTGTTILGWTPPHERTYGRQKVEAETPSETSSDHTIIGFTPPHELYASPPRQAPVRRPPSPPQPATKKTLPWLRKPDTSPARPPTKKSSAAYIAEPRKPSTPLTGWIQASEIAEPSEKKKTQPAEKLQPRASRPLTENEWNELRSSAQPSAPNNYMGRGVAEIVHESASLKIESASPIHADVATQTTFTPAVSRRATFRSSQQEDQPINDRAPPSAGRSQTFPLTTKICKGQFVHPSDESPLSCVPQSSSCSPKVAGEGAERGMQIELESEPEFQTGVGPQIAEKNKLLLNSDSKPGELTHAFPLTAVPNHRVVPHQAPPVSKNTNKSIDECRSEWNKDEKAPEVTKTYKLCAPLRPSPLLLCTQCAPPTCSQCSGPLHPPRSGPDTRPEPELEPTSMKAPTHACTARSSVQCQQCSPSRQVSAAISPREGSSPMEVQPVEVYHIESRSTRPINPLGPSEYPEGSLSPAFVEQVPTDPSRRYYSPKRARTQSKVDQVLREFTKLEPMADPMKRPSPPRLGLGSKTLDPAPASAPKHLHCSSAASRAKSMPPMPKFPVVETPLRSAPVSSVDSCSTKPETVNHRQVFKGLHVATAAACDEDVDKWIEELTGSSARKFLSALSAFDGLGANTLADVARRAAKQRREKVKAWETTREKRIAGQEERQLPDCDIGEECIIGDQGVFVGPVSGSDIGGENGKVWNYDLPAGC
ncbi:hypothetical protein QTJ16_002985 [Diplocarpon rosae]|uniref:Uncharacterized protein n=1 Tax=Diplocarpon rosae TaxID=946125 RepID=A0AAD9WGM4_9HELO|nr:hypothetical protein QTJ16_002985 [Diplocarpon rosae]PBP22860.1 hypothetical protein BUE80_DR006265 [Diplocarpon rosae]